MHFMEALCRANLDYLKAYPLTVPLYQSGVYYLAESMVSGDVRLGDIPRIEDWQDIPTLYRVGNGDCEDLTCARVAELRKQGKWAEPWLKYTQLGNGRVYHALVKLKKGFEDPSRILGMGASQ